MISSSGENIVGFPSSLAHAADCKYTIQFDALITIRSLNCRGELAISSTLVGQSGKDTGGQDGSVLTSDRACWGKSPLRAETRDMLA